MVEAATMSKQDPSPQTSNNLQRRPRGKQVPSRYLSPSPSHSTTTTTSSSSSSSSSTTLLKRHPSPSPIKTQSFPPKRSQSVGRRQQTPLPLSVPEMSAATKMLITSTRSLSVSFQGESFSLPVSKKKEAAITPVRRRSTPVRDQRENSKPVDQQRWPGASRRSNSESNSLTRSLDCNSSSSSRGKVESCSSLLSNSMNNESPRVCSNGTMSPRVCGNGRVSLDLESLELGEENQRKAFEYNASDSESVSSGSTNGVQECGGNGDSDKKRSLPRNIMASARFWQETNSRLRRLQDPGSPLSSSPKNVSAKFGLSSPRGVASPLRGRSASPSKLWAATSPGRAMVSPLRARNGVSEQMNAYKGSSNTPSILSFSADVRRGKIGEDRVVDAHLLRLLYNRYLQWRFVNARADSTSMVQRLNAEKNLWNAWVSISELRHSVTLKRIKLLLLRQKLKLASILRGQMGYLEEWSLMDKDHSSSLSGATESLKASTLRLPIVGKTVVDIQDLKHAVNSAVDVMQAMSSSIFSLTFKVDEMNSVMVETVNITAKEKVLLERCQGSLSRVAAMQVTECSMKTHIIQLSRIPMASSLT